MWSALSDERLICRLQLLLSLASAVILGSESTGTRDHILLSQIRDFPFRCLIRLAGLRWRYSTPPPHGVLSNSRMHCLLHLPGGRRGSPHVEQFLFSSVLSRECLCSYSLPQKQVPANRCLAVSYIIFILKVIKSVKC
jgi:hypothetical protein